jgi:hypothetical protein
MRRTTRALFGGISDGRVVENANVKIVRDCWLDLPNHYPRVSLDAFVMMPDHMHGIIVLLDPYEAGLTSGADWAGLKPAPYTPNRFKAFRTESRYPPPK